MCSTDPQAQRTRPGEVRSCRTGRVSRVVVVGRGGYRFPGEKRHLDPSSTCARFPREGAASGEDGTGPGATVSRFYSWSLP